MDSKVTTRSKDEIIQLLTELKHNLKDAEDMMRNKVQYEDVAMFVGSTKAGKSTLINYIMNNPLIGRKDTEVKSKFNPTKVYKASNANGPDIGCGSASATTVPSRWIASEKFSNLIMWDCPGFCDNRGPTQSITNAYYIYHIFQKIKSVKIVLIVDINDITQDKINSFLTLLSSVENVFKDKIEQCYSSFALIFTKVPPTIEDEPTDVDYLAEILQRQVLSSNCLNISRDSRNLVQYFINNRQNIGFVKKVAGGIISSDIEVGLVQALQTATCVPDTLLKNFSFPSIDSDSKVFLFEVRNDLSSKKTFEEVIQILNNVLKSKLDHFHSINKSKRLTKELLTEEKEKLCSIRNQIESCSSVSIDIFTKLQALKEVDPIIRDKIENSEIVDTLRLMKFIDGLLNMKESDLCNLNLTSTLETVKSQMSRIIVEMQCDLHEIDNKEKDILIDNIQKNFETSILRIKEEAKEAAERNFDISKKLGVFGKVGHTIDKGYETLVQACDKVMEGVNSVINFFSF